MTSIFLGANVTYFDPLDEYSYDENKHTFDQFINPENDNFYYLKLYCCLIIFDQYSPWIF